MIIYILASPVPLVYSQPQGYTLIYSPPRAYYVDWMDVKAIYVKDEEDRLYFYIEYYGAIPNSEDYDRTIYINMDTDRNVQTGAHDKFGLDYYIYLHLYGDNSHAHATMSKWDNASKSSKQVKDLTSNMRRAPGLNCMEIWVGKQDIGYTPNGIDFYMEIYSIVKGMLETELSYVIGSSVKRITIDGEPGDWDSIAPSVTFPSRSINPSELEASSVYIANDDENLYFRIDTREKPSTMINEGTLLRQFLVYLDTDNNNNTGYKPNGGAEFYAYLQFYATLLKQTTVAYLKYAG
jgi:hypothetical protein